MQSKRRLAGTHVEGWVSPRTGVCPCATRANGRQMMLCARETPLRATSLSAASRPRRVTATGQSRHVAIAIARSASEKEPLFKIERNGPCTAFNEQTNRDSVARNWP